MTSKNDKDLGLLDNVFWHALTGPQAHCAAGTAEARRYAAGFSPILAFADAERPDFAALNPFCAFDEHFYVACWSGPLPAGWQLDAEAVMVNMVWDGETPAEDAAPEAIRLEASHAPQALALAELTRPGPFGLRTIELGEYFGVFEGEGEGERLVAMAGERSCAGNLREISGVCTDPDFQGRGLARRLMLKLIRRQVERGETPFLHVMRENDTARALYRRMGFVDYCEKVVRVVSRIDAVGVSKR